MEKTVKQFLAEISSYKWKDYEKPIKLVDRDFEWTSPVIKIQYTKSKPSAVILSCLPFNKENPMFSEFLEELKSLPARIKLLPIYLEAPNGMLIDAKLKVSTSKMGFDFSDENVTQFVLSYD